MTRHLTTSALLVLLFTGSGSAQDKGAALIEGTVYDINEAVIVDVWISIENTKTLEQKNVRTDTEGRYRASVPQGRYYVALRPMPGDPLGCKHASFSVSPGERVMINFRPRPPLTISDSIEGGHWVERYEGSLPTFSTHFIRQPNGAIKDLQVQCGRLRTRGHASDYRYLVVATFDRLSVYADRAVFDPKKARFIAEGNVIFEDGIKVRRATRVELDLRTGSATIAEPGGKPTPQSAASQRPRRASN